MGLISPICLFEAFSNADTKPPKRQSSHQCLLVLLGSVFAKAAFKMLVKLTPDVMVALAINNVSGSFDDKSLTMSVTDSFALMPGNLLFKKVM